MNLDTPDRNYADMFCKECSLRTCENVAIRRRNRLRHHNKSRVCGGGADGFVCLARQLAFLVEIPVPFARQYKYDIADDSRHAIMEA